jgi:hypothetical protein
MFNLKHFGVATALVLTAASSFASNFRAADQVYVPVAGHIAGSGGAVFQSDVFLSNLTDDSVTVTVTFASGTGGTQQSNFAPIQLAPRERREFVDFVSTKLGLTSNLGQLIFNGCKAGTDCGVATQDPTTGISPNYRNISVETRIYSKDANGNTNGQLFPGLPWYSYVSQNASSVGLDKVFITGFRQTGAAPTQGTYRSNIGLVNASQFSNTTLAVKLFDGATSTQIGATYTQALAPLGQTQVNVASIFPAFSGVTATNAYVTVEQLSSTATADSPSGCPNGCPAFFAYGSILDNGSGDATTLESQYLVPLSDAALTCIYGGTCKSGVSLRRAAKH